MHIAAVDGRGDEALPPQGEAVVISFLRLAQMQDSREALEFLVVMEVSFSVFLLRLVSSFRVLFHVALKFVSLLTTVKKTLIRSFAGMYLVMFSQI